MEASLEQQAVRILNMQSENQTLENQNADLISKLAELRATVQGAKLEWESEIKTLKDANEALERQFEGIQQQAEQKERRNDSYLKENHS